MVIHLQLSTTNVRTYRPPIFGVVHLRLAYFIAISDYDAFQCWRWPKEGASSSNDYDATLHLEAQARQSFTLTLALSKPARFQSYFSPLPSYKHVPREVKEHRKRIIVVKQMYLCLLWMD